MIEIREIIFGSDDYRAMLALRHDVLRAPLGLVLGGKDTETDASELLLGAFMNSRLVGCLILRRRDDGVVQMRQVAVDPTIHGQGIGRKLVEEFEKRATGSGAKEIIMDARLTARDFYERLGYSATSDVYIQSTIPHLKMHKVL